MRAESPYRVEGNEQSNREEAVSDHILQADLTLFVRRVARMIAWLFQTTRLAVLAKEKDLYCPVETLGYAMTPAVALSQESDILRHLERLGGPVSTRFDDSESSLWIWDLPDHERAALEDLCVDVLAPIKVKGRVVALVSLGPKRSGELYSGTEFVMLQMLGREETWSGNLAYGFARSASRYHLSGIWEAK